MFNADAKHCSIALPLAIQPTPGRKADAQLSNAPNIIEFQQSSASGEPERRNEVKEVIGTLFIRAVLA